MSLVFEAVLTDVLVLYLIHFDCKKFTCDEVGVVEAISSRVLVIV